MYSLGWGHRAGETALARHGAPRGWPEALELPKKSTKVGARFLLVLHTTILSLIYPIFLGAFFQRDLRSQLGAEAGDTATSLLLGHPKTLQLSNSLLSTLTKPSTSEVCSQHRQNNFTKAIKRDWGDGSSLAGDCGLAGTTEKDTQTSKLFFQKGQFI